MAGCCLFWRKSFNDGLALMAALVEFTALMGGSLLGRVDGWGWLGWQSLFDVVQVGNHGIATESSVDCNREEVAGLGPSLRKREETL